MSTSRRKFLKAGVLTAVFAAVPLKNALGQSWKDRDGNPIPPDNLSDPLSNYTKATFTQYLNSVFQLRTGFSVVAVTLLKIDDLPAAKGGECFSLLFRGGGGPALRQNTYSVDHPALGTFLLFLVPVGADSNGAQGYLATINRLSLKDALVPAPKASATTKREGSIKTEATTTAAPTSTPSPTPNQGQTNTQPQSTQPAQTNTAAPATTPVETIKPVKRKKRPWKRMRMKTLRD